MKTVNVVFAGVGGQGVILASDMLCSLLLAKDFDVKKSEIRGMAQRGGSVVSEVRFGEKVQSPVIPDGEIDFLLSFDRNEGARFRPLVRRPDGVFELESWEHGRLPSEKVANVALLAKFLAHFTTPGRLEPASSLTVARAEILELVRSAVPPKHVEMNLATASAFLD
jgi:indolepyruvate ferredoxin oxidoreductase beta subunit